MAGYRAPTDGEAAFLAALFDAGLLIDSGVPGLYGRGAVFEDVRRRFEALVAAAAEGEGAEAMRFPPLLPRRQLEASGYLSSFPHLAGSVFAFDGTEAEAAVQAERAAGHEDWSEFQRMSELVLTPAACYPVYPVIGARGPLSPGGATVDLGGSYVFRHEPSGDPARLQMFHMAEMIRIGEPDAVAAWRDTWRDRAIGLLTGLGLDARFDIAADPFFGRKGRMLAHSQREQALKFEILVPIASPERTAVASFNYHQEHFASAYGIRLADGSTAHTACLGFGHERIVLALLHEHGLDPGGWPADVRRGLWGR